MLAQRSSIFLGHLVIFVAAEIRISCSGAPNTDLILILIPLSNAHSAIRYDTHSARQRKTSTCSRRNDLILRAWQRCALIDCDRELTRLGFQFSQGRRQSLGYFDANFMIALFGDVGSLG